MRCKEKEREREKIESKRKVSKNKELLRFIGYF